MMGKIVKTPCYGSKSELLYRERRRQIFSAAVQLFGEKGYHTTTVREIADLAGMGKGTIYEYVRSKKELLFLVIEEGHSLLFDELDQLDNSEMPPLEKWNQAMRIQVSIMEGHSNAVRALLPEIKGLEQTEHDWMDHLKKKYIARFQSIFDDCVEAGVFRKMDSFVACEIACNSFMLWEESTAIRERMSGSVENYVEFVTSLLMDGIAANK